MTENRRIASGFVWNMIGSCTYSASSFVYLMFVTRMLGTEKAGFFSLSYATAQLLLTVGRFGVRTYQATDISGQYTFRQYKFMRVFTVLAMLLAGAVYAALAFPAGEAAACFAVVFMKAVDAVEDVYHGELQRRHRIREMGLSQTLRNLYSPVCFVLTLAKTRDLLVSCALTAASSLVLCLLWNERVTGDLRGTEGERRSVRAALLIVRSCAGIFAGTFLSILLYNIPKYAMAGVLPKESQTYYSIMFMPSFVLTLACEFLYKPTITTISERWWAGEKKRVVRSILAIAAFLFAAGAAFVICGDLIGRRLLELVYRVELGRYRFELIVLLAGGGISAAVYLLYNLLIALRSVSGAKYVYVLTAAVTAAASVPMVRSLGIMGACVSYCLSGLCLLLAFAWMLIRCLRRPPEAGAGRQILRKETHL